MISIQDTEHCNVSARKLLFPAYDIPLWNPNCEAFMSVLHRVRKQNEPTVFYS